MCCWPNGMGNLYMKGCHQPSVFKGHRICQYNKAKLSMPYPYLEWDKTGPRPLLTPTSLLPFVTVDIHVRMLMQM